MIYNSLIPLGTTMPVTVPKDFVGLHYWGWPQLAVPSLGWTNIPAPTNVNHAVSWCFDWHATAPGKISWGLMEPTQGNYVWADFDAFVAGQASLGKVVTYYMHHMPSWASANPTLGQSSGSGDGFGGPLNANGRTGLANFINTMIARYKAKGTPIKYFSTWEEPNQFAGPYNGTTITNAGTWWGSKGDLVDLSWITYSACKAADPNIVVYSASTADNNAGPDVWIGSTGTVNTTKRGYDCYDVYTIDPFGYAPTQFDWGTDVFQPTYTAGNQLQNLNGSQGFSNLVASIRAKMIVGGKTTPIAFVSSGYTGAYNSPAIVGYFRGKTSLFRKQYIARSMLEAAALGVTHMTWYGADTNNTLGIAVNQPIGTAASNQSEFSGNFLADTNGVIAGLNEFAANVPGKTITSCGYRVDGSMFATFSDGSNYSI